jgi:general secretion pathway protein J
MRRRARGFTLIELMVAVMITAVLISLGYSALQQSLNNRQRIKSGADRLQSLQYTMRSLVQDFSQLAPRPVREPQGEGQTPAIAGILTDNSLVTFTRAGWMNPAGVQRSNLQRVRYSLADGKLVREYWTVLDAMLDPPPVRRELIDRVKSFRIRYLNDARAWQDSWPPPALGSTRPERELRWRPTAVEITLELEDWGRMTRLIEVAG